MILNPFRIKITWKSYFVLLNIWLTLYTDWVHKWIELSILITFPDIGHSRLRTRTMIVEEENKRRRRTTTKRNCLGPCVLQNKMTICSLTILYSWSVQQLSLWSQSVREMTNPIIYHCNGCYVDCGDCFCGAAPTTSSLLLPSSYNPLQSAA